MAATLAELMVRLGIDAKEFTQGLNDVNKRLTNVGKSLTDIGKNLSLKVTAPIVAAGTGILMAAGNFERGMNKVRAITGATGEDMAALEEQARRLGATTQFSAGQAADAMGFLAMAGFDVQQILGAMPGTLQLAASAQLDLASAADIVTNVLTGYGLQVEDLARVNDVLAKAFTSSNTDLRQLGQAMKFAGPLASAAGVRFEEAAAAIGLMGNAGIQASMAGTSLRGAITRLLSPTNEAAQVLSRLGITAVDSQGNLRSLVDIVAQLEASGATAADMMTIFGQRAGPAMQALVDQGSDALRDFVSVLDDSAGTAERVSSVQMEGLHGALTRLKSAAEGLAISIAKSGLIEWATNFADRAAELVSRLSESNPALLRAATAVAAMAAAAGPTLIALGAMAKGFAALVGPIKAVGLALRTLSAGPHAPLVAIVTAAAFAATLIIVNWDRIKASTLDMVSAVTGALATVVAKVSDVADRIPLFGDRVASGLRGFSDNLREFADNAARAAEDARKSIDEETSGVGEDMVESLGASGLAAGRAAGEGIADGLEETRPQIQESMADIVSDILSAENALIQLEEAIGRLDAPGAMDRLIAALEELDSTTTTAHQAFLNFFDSWSGRLDELTDEELRSAAEVLAARLATIEDTRGENDLLYQMLNALAIEFVDEERRRSSELKGLDAINAQRGREAWAARYQAAADASGQTVEKAEETDRSLQGLDAIFIERGRRAWAARLQAAAQYYQQVEGKEKSVQESVFTPLERIFVERGRAAWSARLQAAADYYNRVEEDAEESESTLAGLEALQLERSRAAWAARYQAAADYYDSADERARQSAEEQARLVEQRRQQWESFATTVQTDLVGAFEVFFNQIREGANFWKALGEGAKDFAIAVVSMLEQQVIAQKAAGIATAVAQAPVTLGASLLAIPGIIAEAAVALAALEGVKSIIRGIKLAEGGTIVSPGMALVGEAGPELVNLPRGASVIPLDRTLGGGAREQTIMVMLDGRVIAKAAARGLPDVVRVHTGIRV